MNSTDQNGNEDKPTVNAMRSSCPQCAAPSRVVTAVTVKTLGTRPRTVLVTYRCESPSCLFKYPLPKPETELTDEERALWR